MHTKRVSFSKFFTDLQSFDFAEIARIFESRLIGKDSNIDLLVNLSKNANKHLIKTNSFIIVIDLRTLRILHVSPSVKPVLGYTPEEFMNGGVSQFIKNYCPADRLNGKIILDKITAHQKQPGLMDKNLYQYINTYRFLNKWGYYSWIYNRMIFVAHDEKTNPMVSFTIASKADSYYSNDKISFARLKFNKSLAKYETEFEEEYQPEYLNILKPNELEILRLLAIGLDNGQIAAEMKLSEHTIKSYRKKMLKKTWCENMAELLAFALRNGLIS